MKYKALSVLITSMIGLAGCGVSSSDYQNDNGTPNDNSYVPKGVVNKDSNNHKMEDFGYSRMQAPSTNEHVIDKNFSLMDRRELANTISKNAILVSDVEDVATLVTDKEVLIAYTTNSQDPNLVADQIKKSALSMVPRYYHVYVSDDPHMKPLIDRYQGLDATTKNVRNSLDSVIQEFKKSPQGENVSDQENANGERFDETNNQLNH